MSYSATVLRAMIASPSDVTEARDAVERAIYGWNDANARSKSVILQPWRWETSSVPVMGGHPQKLINAQGVDDSDIVFALFGGRLGSPTPDAVSGTAEEIDRALDLGKPVHLYFSTVPLPHDIDTEQLEALRTFKTEMQERGLLGEFSNPEQLGHEVWKAIEHDIATLDLSALSPITQPSGVKFLVQPRQEREIRDYDKKGKPRYKTRHWIEVTNNSSVDAEQVVFETIGEHSGMFLVTDGSPTTIHAGQARHLNVEHAMGGSDPDILRIRWVEDGEGKEQDFHVG